MNRVAYQKIVAMTILIFVATTKICSKEQYITFENTWRDDVQVSTTEQKANYGITGDSIVKAFKTKKILMTDGQYKLNALTNDKSYISEVYFYVQPSDTKFKIAVNGNRLLQITKAK